MSSEAPRGRGLYRGRGLDLHRAQHADLKAGDRCWRGAAAGKEPGCLWLAATNRHTRYRKAGRDAWREGLVAFATGFRGFDDLASRDAPWIVEGNQLTGHLFDLPDVEAVLRVLGDDAVVFCGWTRRCKGVELSGGSQDIPSFLETVCLETLRRTDAGGQQDAMEERARPALGESKKPLRP